MPAVTNTTPGRLHCELVRILFLQTHRETDYRFFAAASGVELTQTKLDFFHYHHTVFYSPLKSKVANILAKATALSINLNIASDGVPQDSRSHTHPSHSQTSRILSSSLSLGIPFPRST